VIAVSVASLTPIACGGHDATSGHGDQYLRRKVASEEIEKVLKADARVEDFETDGDKLIVTVKESWMHSPPGMKQFSIGQWFNQWKGEKGEGAKSVQVVVRYDGEDVAKATAAGIEFATKSEKNEGQ
jgi:hypothetical protein